MNTAYKMKFFVVKTFVVKYFVVIFFSRIFVVVAFVVYFNHFHPIRCKSYIIPWLDAMNCSFSHINYNRYSTILIYTYDILYFIYVSRDRKFIKMCAQHIGKAFISFVMKVVYDTLTTFHD